MKTLLDITLNNKYDITLSSLRAVRNNVYFVGMGIYEIPVDLVLNSYKFKNKEGIEVLLYGIVYDNSNDKISVIPLRDALVETNYTEKNLSTNICEKNKEYVFKLLYEKYIEGNQLDIKAKLLKLNYLDFELLEVNNKKEIIKAPSNIDNLEQFFNLVCKINIRKVIIDIPLFLYYMLYHTKTDLIYNEYTILRPKTKLGMDLYGNITYIGFDDI